MERQEYPAMLATLQPGQAIDVLNDRVRQVGSLNAHIADWLQERKRLEEQYSSGLRKLARRQPPGDGTELGVFSVPWSTLTNSLDTMADSHHAFATKIESDVERPLRDFTHSNREMQAMTTIQGNLASLARDIEMAQRKNERLAHKGGKAKTVTVASASNELDNAQSQWENQAPYVFEQLQALDETRLNQLRDVLTQFQTHEVDRVERDRTLSEQCLNILLNVETKDEIQTFALRNAQGGAPQSRPSTMQTPRSRQSMIGPSAPNLAAQPSGSHLADDAVSQRSGSLPSEPEKKSGLKGLKRLGTVLGRRRESKIILPQRSSESPERPKANAFNSFSSRFGRGRDLPTPLEDEESSPRPRSPLRTMTSSSTVPTSPATTEREPAHIDGTAQSLIAAGLMPNGHQNHQGHTSDVAQLQEPLQPSAPEPSQPVSREVEAPRDNEGFSLPPQHLDPISQAEAEAADGSQPAFNVNIRQAPIAEEGSDAALASMANTLKMQAPPTNARRAGTVRGRRDMRASVYVPPSNATPEPVIQESVASSPDLAPPVSLTREIQPTPTVTPPATANSAFALPPAIQTQSQTQPSLSLYPAASPGGLPSVPQSPASPTFSSPVSRGGTDTTFSPFHGSAAAVAASVFNRPTSSVGPGSTFDHNDTQSIRSGRSLSSSTSQGISKHPTDLGAPGLNASIVETVSAWFEHGLCTRSVVIGEVGLVNNGSQAAHGTIRLDNFAKLEKVAPNPGFISDAASGSKGEYTVDVKQISKLGIAFKYQLASSSSSAGDLAPVLLTTAWKIEKGTAMCILSYSLNPSFILPAGASTADVKNLTLSLHLGPDGAKAQTCMSKPVGTFDRTRNTIYWNLGDVSLSSTPSKLLAKFGTGDAEAKQGHVEAKWEILGAASTGSGLQVSVKEEAGAAEVDPFADESERGSEALASWRGISGARKIVSGTYHAQ